MLREYKFGGPIISSRHLNPPKNSGLSSARCFSSLHFLNSPSQEAREGSAANTVAFLPNSLYPKQAQPGRGGSCTATLSAVGHCKKYRSFHNRNLDPFPTACAGAPAPLGCWKGDVRGAARARDGNNFTLLTQPLGQAPCRGPGCLVSRPAGI